MIPSNFTFVALHRRLCTSRDIAKAAEDSRTPKPGGGRWAHDVASAFWSAAVLCRFFPSFIGSRTYRTFRKLTYSCVPVLVALLPTGCKTFRPVEDLTRYYILSPSAMASTPAPSNRNITIGIAPVEIPSYLQNSRIAVRRGTNEIHYAENREWAEHLDKGIQRVLASDLAILAPGTKIITSAWQSRDVKAEVHISIRRFDLDESGQVTLDCEWRISSPNGQPIHIDTTFIAKKGPPLTTNPAAAVSTLSEALADLSKKIAAALPDL